MKKVVSVKFHFFHATFTQCDLAHDFTADANNVNNHNDILFSDEFQDNSNMDPSVQPKEGEGLEVESEDLDKKQDKSQHEKIVVVSNIEELPPNTQEVVFKLPDESESCGIAPCPTTVALLDKNDDLWEVLPLEEHTCEPSTSSLRVPVTVDGETSDSEDEIFEVPLEEHPNEPSASSPPVTVTVDEDNSDSDGDAFSLLELADTHLQCPICMEVFIMATTINCGHTFCQECIQDWKKKHKVCPYCRTKIKVMVTSNVIDQFITEMFGLLDEEGLERRREFARQREDNKKKKKK